MTRRGRPRIAFKPADRDRLDTLIKTLTFEARVYRDQRRVTWSRSVEDLARDFARRLQQAR
jgi:hypothetical protein